MLLKTWNNIYPKLLNTLIFIKRIIEKGFVLQEKFIKIAASNFVPVSSMWQRKNNKNSNDNKWKTALTMTTGQGSVPSRSSIISHDAC